MAPHHLRTLDTLPEPPRESLNTHYILGEIIDHIDSVQCDFPHVKISVLKARLWDIRNKKLNPETHLRGFLNAFEDTLTYQNAVAKLDDGMRMQLDMFLKGACGDVVLAPAGKSSTFALPASPAAQLHFRECAPEEGENSRLEAYQNAMSIILATNGDADLHVDNIRPVTKRPANSPQIFEDVVGMQIMEVYGSTAFKNWAQSVQNTPLWTFIPRTVIGLQNLVRWAKKQDLRVRVSGYRHSLSSTFSQDDQILVSLLNLEDVTKPPSPLCSEPSYIDPYNELKTIQLTAPPGVVASSADKALCRVGVAITNEEFRRWQVANDKWALPVNVDLLEVTTGGITGAICHGSGRAHKTINDYIRAIEYVDANGFHQTISEPAQLLVAAGHFGLLGIVTHITFELDRMSYAILQPTKPDVGLAVPPLSRGDIPIALRKTFTQEQYDAALVDFENRAENDHYAEWVWFARNQQVWLNTWSTTNDRMGVVEYPSLVQTWLQWVEGWLRKVITDSEFFRTLPGRWQGVLLGTLGMVGLPHFGGKVIEGKEGQRVVTALPNALHVHRGVRQPEMPYPEHEHPCHRIPPSHPPPIPPPPHKPDYTIIQRAWWDVINLCYEDDASPLRLNISLRIMGDSKVLMAPQRGNAQGTACIEVCSVPGVVGEKEWGVFVDRVVKKWGSYKDSEGNLLNLRPHWAKEWENTNIRGLPAREYLKTQAYKDEIPRFKAILTDIGKKQGWELSQIRRRFSNDLWDYMIYLLDPFNPSDSLATRMMLWWVEFWELRR